jgi:hypothetical protein
MKRLFLIGLAVLVAASPATPKAKPAELKWMDTPPPGLPAGATFAVVSGDPGKAGKFTVRIKMPSNYAVRPHWHLSDEKVTLVSGKLAYGMSDQLSRTGGEALAPGASVVMKAKMHHWVYTGDGAEVEVSATGPFKITYVHPGDDPRGAPKANE